VPTGRGLGVHSSSESLKPSIYDSQDVAYDKEAKNQPPTHQVLFLVPQITPMVYKNNCCS